MLKIQVEYTAIYCVRVYDQNQSKLKYLSNQLIRSLRNENCFEN